jgi:hypothetical protein
LDIIGFLGLKIMRKIEIEIEIEVEFRSESYSEIVNGSESEILVDDLGWRILS